MKFVAVLIFGLVYGQFTDAQRFFDETVNDDPFEASGAEVEVEEGCPLNKMGKNCAYDLYSLDPEVPWTEHGQVWKSDGTTCAMYGQAGVFTFDGLAYTHTGYCTYTMFEMPHCTVKVQRSPVCRHGECIKAVEVHHADCTVIMHSNFTSIYMPDGGGAMAFGLDQDFTHMNVHVTKHDTVRQVHIDGGAIRIDFDGRSDVYVVLVNLPEDVPVQGLCGDRNRDKDDDKIDAGKFMDQSSCEGETYALPPVDRMCVLDMNVLSACMIMTQGFFAELNKRISPLAFVHQCVEEMCLCNFMENDYCLCDVVQQYTRVCAAADPMLEIKDWRTTPCSVSCRSNMQWTECGRYGVERCSSIGIMAVEESPCQARCQCRNGEVWDAELQLCVNYDSCSCYHKGATYQTGDYRMEGCVSCLCQGGFWQCPYGVCNATAMAYGHYHYKTFDGAHFTAWDDCQVLLAEDIDGNFQVYVQNFQGEKFRAEKDVNVFVRMGTHVMHYLLSREGELFSHVHGVLATPGLVLERMPYTRRGVVDITRMGERGFEVLLVQFGVRILFDGIGFLVVHVPGEYANRMRGIGGNFNGIIYDDETLPSGENAGPYDLVHSWRKDYSCVSDQFYHPSICFGDEIDHICGHILDFANTTCGVREDLDHLKHLCIEDACNANFDMSVDMTCTYLKGAVGLCSLHGVKDDTLNTHITEICPVTCPADKVYSDCSSSCSSSCQSVGLFCATMCYPGCFCPEGTYEDADGSCVSQENCGCFYEGTWYESGSISKFINDTKVCSCSGGMMECEIVDPGTLCPGELEYFECATTEPGFAAAGCLMTCEQPFMVGRMEECVDGCACPPGMYATPDMKCVPLSECGCVGTGGKYFASGESYEDDCNTCFCEGGTFTCTNNLCPKTCSSSGGSHYQTFDGLAYDFHGECEYVLATDFCPNNPGGGLFSIVTRNQRCGTTGMTCSKSVVITIKNKQITLKQGQQKPVITTIANTRFRRAITGYTDHNAAEIFLIKQKGLFTEISTCIGVTILWDNGTRIYVRLTSDYATNVCGLCGNFDGIDTNDYTTSTGIMADPVEFGNSWKIPETAYGCPDATPASQINDTCTKRPERRIWAEEKCGVILDHDLFAECHAKINPQRYFDACVLDTCGCDSGGDCECTCTAIAHYAHLCAQKGVVVEWRNMKRCPLMCEIYNKDEEECRWHYRACETCITDTCCPCQSSDDDSWCVEGCFPKCPEGFILDEMTQKCVAITNSKEGCTRYSAQNKCRVCETCDVCKTKSGAVLRIKPGETKYFPLDTDTCQREWCAATTDGDLCYNGTSNLYICEEEYKPIPDYDPYFYELICVNSTTSLCKNCRDCEKNCIDREDTCDEGKKIGDRWSKIFEYDPVPSIGPKTYCKNYECVAHPDATEPQCNLQREDVQGCVDSGKDKVCEWYEVLTEFETGDPCCPVKYECVCVTCEHSTGEKDASLKVGDSNYWCKDDSESNCCYTDTCYNKTAIQYCPKIERVQEACPTGPTPTCSTGYAWVNKTRPDDCCPWGECECDSCVDYDLQNNKRLMPVGAEWNKKCLRFKCVRGVKSDGGCYRAINHENTTCAAEPDCPERMHSVIYGRDEFDCCNLYRCECDKVCFVNNNGTVNAFPPGTEWMMNGCWHHCTDPLDGADGPRLNQTDCPYHRQICQKPTECPECHVPVGWQEDMCGCQQFVCEEIARCPVITCDYPFQRDVIPSDPCEAPCYNCTCDHVCLDPFDNRTYVPGETWRRTYRKTERKCEDCTCTNDRDVEDKCLREVCEPVPCPDPAECTFPYDVPITDTTSCGCTDLIECQCPYCRFEGTVMPEKEVGSSWTIGGQICYDTYNCLWSKDVGKDKECYNVTKTRNDCPPRTNCSENYVSVKDEERSCCYDDGECCDIYKCVCNVCMFDGVAYQVGEKWTKDCLNYVCTDTRDEQDPNKCFLETYEVVPCTNDTLPVCQDCYKLNVLHERQVPEYCCPVYNCEKELFCYHENGTKIANGTEWYDLTEDPNGCVKRRCYVSKTAWEQGTCPEKVKINPCMPDTTECEKCENKTMGTDVCGCPKINCSPLNPPVQCLAPADNQKVISLSTEDECFASKNCCVCDSTCLYKGVRRTLYETWWDEETCQRMRCVIPEVMVAMLNKDADDWDGIKQSLDYRDLMEKSGKAKVIYSECQQDPKMCPEARDVGCPDPIPCKECQTTTPGKDECGCDINICEDYVCPPSPYDVETCSPPKSKRIEVSLNGLHPYFPCCPTGFNCTCPDGCYDTSNKLRAVGEQWEETVESDCGSKRRYTCRLARDDDPHECPQVEEIPCAIPEPCPNCFDTVSTKDEYCCLQVECTPVPEPTQCVETAANQKIVSMATADECFPQKNCCICDSSCLYKGIRRKLYETWWDEETCQRMRCIIPEVMLDMMTSDPDDWESIKDELDYRDLMEKSGKAKVIYSECQQDPKMCPEARDVGCPDPIPCKECQTTTPGKDECGCDINICEDYVCPPSPYDVETCSPPKSKRIEVSLNGLHPYFPCCPTGFNCTCPDGCYDTSNKLRAVGEKWEETVEDDCGSKRRYTCRLARADDPHECPQVEEIPCVIPEPCPNCYDTISSKDEYCCEQLECVPVPDAVECVDPAANQKIVTMATGDECFPSKNCCVCDTSCLYKGIRRKLYETWWDEETCQRMRCVIPEVMLDMMTSDPDDWESIKDELDYRDLMEKSGKAKVIYSECQQDPKMCPEARDVGCPDPIPCKECQTTTPGKDECGCDINICEDYVCPPSPYDVETCSPPKSKRIEVSLNGLHPYFPCCPTGFNCTCPDGCYDTSNKLRAVGEQWEETVEDNCGSKRRYTCRLATSEDPHECPQVEEIPCVDPNPCPDCHVTMSSKDEYCCTQYECVPMVCNVTTKADCEEKYYPFTVIKTDAVKTKNECCPYYCECPDVCVDDVDQSVRQKEERWLHPKSSCWYRRCLVDESRDINQGCPYMVNETVCVEPDECGDCFHKVDTIDNCGCTVRECVRDECPRPNCTDECKEIVDSGLKDSCQCPVLECKLKECAKTNLTCDDPEMDVYKFMDPSINVCCPQYGCRCNFSRCEDPVCADGQVAVRNLTDQRCCCPKYDCLDKPPSTDYCMIGTEKKTIGEKWVNKDNVCEMMQCTYLNPHSKTKTKIDIFPRYTCSSTSATRTRRAICANNEPSYTAQTKNGCCRESVCPCTCELFGDPHFRTFDGLNYDFQGKCTYTLMKEYRFNETEILVDNELCRWWSARDKDLSCMKTLVVLHKGNNYTFTSGQKFFYNNKRITFFDAWQLEGSDVRVETFSFLTLEMHIMSLGIHIVFESYASYQSLLLKIPYETYEGQMEGLCGTCNNDQSDDLRGKGKILYDASIVADVDKFGDSWLKNVKDYDHSKCYPVEPECPQEPEYPDCPTEMPPDKCINCENRCHLTHPKCQECPEDPCAVMAESSAFEECRSQVDPEGYEPQCRFDLALLTNDTAQKCDPCNSPSVVQFATKCETVGKCAFWRSSLGCEAPQCPENMVFQECVLNAMKYRSCDNLTVLFDDGIRVEGCFCPEGQVRESSGSNKCIPTKCCFACQEAPSCDNGGEAVAQGEDECGCPVYYCQGTGSGGGCAPVPTSKSGITAINEAGMICVSMATIDTNLCGGTCSSQFSLSATSELVETCNSCQPTASETKTISLACPGGADMQYEYQNHLSCSCTPHD